VTTTDQPELSTDTGRRHWRPEHPPELDGPTTVVVAIWLALFIAGLLIYAAH
jgi:hypothetical protein